MKLFLDSADVGEIRALARWGVLDGVTTNPTFIRRLGVADTRAALREIVATVAGEIEGGETHVEALGADADAIVAAAHANRELGDNVVSKVPIDAAGLEATSRLAREGLRVNVHLVFTVNQLVLAARAGAAYVCPLLGRMRDAGIDADAVLGEMLGVLDAPPGLGCELMASSIRDAASARGAIVGGARVLTLPGRVLREMIESPLTARALERFVADARQCETQAPTAERRAREAS
ncbi:MAG: hypothetical protein KC503_23585 [Myxococcales bacterium]|nr:hypothetical protein [Myxococcales bacterium]